MPSLLVQNQFIKRQNAIIPARFPFHLLSAPTPKAFYNGDMENI